MEKVGQNEYFVAVLIYPSKRFVVKMIYSFTNTSGRVGKTSIVVRYIRGEYDDKQVSTLQASYLDKRITLPDKAAVFSFCLLFFKRMVSFDVCCVFICRPSNSLSGIQLDRRGFMP